MFVWRLASGRYPPLAGDGARLVGGRWNSPGCPLIYASESIALCLAECLVHVTGTLPGNYMAFKIEFPDSEVEVLNTKLLNRSWKHNPVHTRAVGDKWLRELRSLALIVPSVVLPESRNILLNPQHPHAIQIRLISQQPFSFDPWLRPGP